VQVVLVTRQGCHLCDEALEMMRELGVEPELADVDADDDLYRLYDWRVPVVLVNGGVAAEGKIERSSLRRVLGGAIEPDR
jgi:predicted thioredoxin/glutaredoxin